MKTIAFAFLVLSTPAFAYTELPPPDGKAPNLSGLHDFDFIAGEWRAHHRKLKERLAGSHEWVEFDGTQSAHLILGGYGNADDNVMNGYRGFTIRAYDPKTGAWRIWWLDGRYPDGAMDPPVVGRFENGVGTFLADDTFKGKPVKVRFQWSHKDANHSHWEQAFSADGGKSWETNWTTDFERIR
ncbi:MAG TPA: hypothetical protein VG889_07745 [Rhizomicrobium sp.]|nr:hypothetical protein [Rhizomicrobium sp.]